MHSSDDKQFDALRAQRQAQYGVTIAFIKERVGDGTEYANEVAHAVLSPSGGYCQLAEMPEEFVGALGSGVSHRVIAIKEAQETMQRLERLLEAVGQEEASVRALSLYVVYAGGCLRTRRQLFVFDHKDGQPPFAHGALLPGVVPRFFKLHLDAADEALPSQLGLPPHGIVFFLAAAQAGSGLGLLATITRTPGSLDLGSLPASPTMN